VPDVDRDEVTERRDFELANPDVAISSDEGGWKWWAQGRLANGRLADVCARSLLDLMDILHMLAEMSPSGT
jgi:hypothetical protein